MIFKRIQPGEENREIDGKEISAEQNLSATTYEFLIPIIRLRDDSGHDANEHE